MGFLDCVALFIAQPVISKARKESYDGGASETSGRVDYTSGGYASVEGDDDSDADYYGEGSDSTGRYVHIVSFVCLSVCLFVCLSVCLSVIVMHT